MKKPVEERFWQSVDKSDSCWLFSGRKNARGYGVLYVKRKTKMAHRYSYELLVGPIPEGLTIDHLCRVKNCVNPEHLEVVTLAENTKRRFPHTKTGFCIKGHERPVFNRRCFQCMLEARTSDRPYKKHALRERGTCEYQGCEKPQERHSRTEKGSKWRRWCWFHSKPINRNPT